MHKYMHTVVINLWLDIVSIIGIDTKIEVIVVSPTT